MSRGKLAPDTPSRNAASCTPTDAATTAHSSIGALAPSPRSSSLHLAWLILALTAASAWVSEAAIRASLSPTPRRSATEPARPRPRNTSWVARLVGPGDVGRGVADDAGGLGAWAGRAGGVGILPPSFAHGLHADLSPLGRLPRAVTPCRSGPVVAPVSVTPAGSARGVEPRRSGRQVFRPEPRRLLPGAVGGRCARPERGCGSPGPPTRRQGGHGALTTPRPGAPPGRASARGQNAANPQNASR